MSRNSGETLYRYTLRNGKLYIHECVIVEECHRRFVYIKDVNYKGRCPKEDELGVINAKGPTLWLDKRDDEVAKDMFVRYEMECIADLEDQLNKKQALLKMLMEEA